MPHRVKSNAVWYETRPYLYLVFGIAGVLGLDGVGRLFALILALSACLILLMRFRHRHYRRTHPVKRLPQSIKRQVTKTSDSIEASQKKQVSWTNSPGVLGYEVEELES